MRVNVVLDKDQPIYTNLDHISGKVCLRVPKTTAISSVSAKLEGESRTRLRPTTDVGESQKTRVEVHKVIIGFLLFNQSSRVTLFSRWNFSLQVTADSIQARDGLSRSKLSD